MCSSTPRNRFLLARLCGIPLFAASFSASVAGQCYYAWEQIPNPAGWWCSGKAINNLGHVARNLSNLGENRRGFFLDTGSWDTNPPVAGRFLRYGGAGYQRP